MIYSKESLLAKFENFLKYERQEISKDIILNIILIGKNSASQKYIEIKQTFGKKINVDVNLEQFSQELESDLEITKEIQTLLKKSLDLKNGLIFQLPVPKQFNYLVKETPIFCDVDLLSKKNSILWHQKFLPPTIGAIDLVLKDIIWKNSLDIQNFKQDFLDKKLDLKGKIVTIIGQGSLVGGPLLQYFKDRRATILSLNEFTPNIQNFTKKADILVCAAGSPDLITQDYLNPKSIIIDASTSESHGKLVGDVNKKGIFDTNILCPSPGGIGKITVSYLFWNLLKLQNF